MKHSLKPLLASALLAVSATTGLHAQNVNAVVVPSGNPPTGMTSASMAATNAHPNGAGSVVFTNVRFAATGWSINDYVVGSYTISPTTGALTLVKADRYPGIGVYYEDEVLLGTDLTSLGSLTLGSTPLAWNKIMLLTSTTPLTATVQAGSSITVKVVSASVAYNIVVTEKATGNVIYNQPGGAATTLWHWPVALLRSGAYNIQFVPVTGTAFRGYVQVTHNNGASTLNLPNGGAFKFALPSESISYAKAKVHLVAGQKLKVAFTISSPVDIRIVNPDNTLLTANSNFTSGKTLTSDAAPSTGDYTVFVRKTLSAASIGGIASSSGVITVLP